LLSLQISAKHDNDAIHICVAELADHGTYEVQTAKLTQLRTVQKYIYVQNRYTLLVLCPKF